MPSKTPEHPPTWAPTQPPIIPPSSTSSTSLHQPQTSIHFSPPLVAMVVIAAAAFLLVAYSSFISHHLFPPLRRTLRRVRRWKFTRRHSEFPASDTESFPPHHRYDSSDGFYVYSPYGLDDTVINNIPLTIYKNSRANSKLEVYELDDMHDCAVCLLELEDGDYMRTLPHCFHSFHADCIDIWLRAHATCPICRAGMSPMMMPIMAARIRPSLDEGVLLESVFLAPLLEQNSGEIQPEFSPERRRDFLLKRCYSFSFERSFATSERVLLGAATTPHRHHHQRRRSFWARRPSSTTPFNSIAKSRVSKFRNYRGTTLTKSPGFFRRRSFFPMSESSASMRWLKSAPSPMFGRAGLFSSSRMRLGDPEALISPERYER